jgi:hypothetical protein
MRQSGPLDKNAAPLSVATATVIMHRVSCMPTPLMMLPMQVLRAQQPAAHLVMLGANRRLCGLC